MLLVEGGNGDTSALSFIIMTPRKYSPRNIEYAVVSPRKTQFKKSANVDPAAVRARSIYATHAARAFKQAESEGRLAAIQEAAQKKLGLVCLDWKKDIELLY